MTKRVAAVLLGISLLPAGMVRAGQAAAPKDPISTTFRSNLTHIQNFIVKSAESMPEENYGMRPGPQKEVRTFGQLIGHLANFSYFFCADAKNEKNPKSGTNYEKLTSKKELIQALNESFHYCDDVYAGISDANLNDTVSATRDDGSKFPAQRFSRMLADITHDQEHYGNIVTYMRIKSLVPASSAQ